MAAPTEYDEGTKVVVTATFDVSDVDTDPTTVVFTARRRLSTGALEAATTYTYGTDSEVTKNATGVYLLTFIPAAGTWFVHAQGTGTAYAAGEVEFVVKPSEALA